MKKYADLNLKKYKIANNSFFKILLRFLICIGVYIFFHESFETFLNNYLIKYIFGKTYSIWYNDLIIFVCLIYSIGLVIFRFHNYIPSKRILFVYFFLISIYLGYRFIFDIYTFTGSQIWPIIKYTDVICIIGLLQFVLLIPNKEIKLNVNSKSFLVDEPLGVEGVDKYGYEGYADEIAERIKARDFSKSFAIGINGKWGMGKTSFCDLLKRRLKDENIITIDFNAWNNQSPKAIIIDFFASIQEAIRPFHSNLSRLLINYSHKLVDIRDNDITKSIHFLVSAITGLEPLNSLHYDIDESLKEINKKIVIFIDDLDRLDGLEISEVLRLVRNTANFSNTYFIIAYDKNYVLGTLKSVNPYINSEFLEKIFQLEVNLPLFQTNIISEQLLLKLKEKLPESLNRELDGIFSVENFNKPLIIKGWIDSMRDVNRLVNGLSVNIAKLTGEVEFADFIRLEILKYKFYSIYELFRICKGDFLMTGHDSSALKNYYTLSKEGAVNATDENLLIKKYLLQNFEQLGIKEGDINVIILLLKQIFNVGNEISILRKSHLSIVFPSKYDRYFAFRLYEDDLSELEFSKARDQNFIGFKFMIDKWNDNGLVSAIRERIAEIKEYDDREDFEKIIRIMFYMGNVVYNQKSDSLTYFNYSMLLKDLYDKIGNYNNRIVNIYYNVENGLSIYKEFILSLFDNAISPFLFESSFIRYLNKEHTSWFFLTKDDLLEISMNYLINYSKGLWVIDDTFWKLFHYCKQTNWIDNGNNSSNIFEHYPEPAKKIFIDMALNRDLDGFIISILKKEPFKDGLFKLSDFVLFLFESYEKLKSELTAINRESEYLVEFLKFFDVYAAGNYENYVHFVFNTIPVEEISN